jgi:phosphoglycolate phosphatase
MSQFNTVLFDLDGTLLDTLGDLADSVNYVLSRFCFEKRTDDEVKSFIGNGIPTLLRRALPPDADTEICDKALEYFIQYYNKNMTNRTRPYEGIEEMLRTLKGAGFKIGVVSNKKDFAVKELCSYFFGGLIDSALGSTAEDTRKPSPKMVFDTLEVLKSDKESTVYVGDSDTDIQTAKNAGVDMICVGWGYRSIEFLKENGAGKIAADPWELLTLLTK